MSSEHAEWQGAVPREVGELISRHSARWNHSSGMQESTLLKLSILRDIVRSLHAEKSRFLAQGRREDSGRIREIERRAESLRSAASLELPLEEAFQKEHNELKKRTRLLPEAMFSIIQKDKFERYDRTWEAAIAAEAVHLGWRFWLLDAWVAIAQAEPLHHSLADQLLPHGVILFAESASSFDQTGQSTMDSDPTKPDLWHGRWLIVVHPKFNAPDFPVKQLAGISQEPSPPQWKLLFSPNIG